MTVKEVKERLLDDRRKTDNCRVLEANRATLEKLLEAGTALKSIDFVPEGENVKRTIATLTHHRLIARVKVDKELLYLVTERGVGFLRGTQIPITKSEAGGDQN